MRKRFLIFIAAVLSICLASSAFALPKGAVKLSSDKRFTSGNIQCGKIGKKWLSGTLINSKGFFVTHTQQSKNYKSDAANATGKKKKNLLTKAKLFASKAKSEAATCAVGHASATKLSVVGAKTLLLLPPLTSGASSETVGIAASTNRLLKISADGFITEVTFTDDEGNTTVTDENPVAVYDVDQSYVIVLFGLDDLNISNGYLVRKGDGKIFSLEGAGFPSRYPTNTNFKNGKVVQTDQSGDIYYKTRSTGASGFGVFDLLKIDTSNPDQLTSTAYSPTDESIYNFAVNSQGNVVYNSRLKTDLNSEYYRIKKTNGGLQNIPLSSVYWVGIDQGFYYQSSGSVTKRAVIDDSGNVSMSDYGTYTLNVPTIATSYKFDFTDRQIFADTTNSGYVVEVNNPSENPRAVSGLPITTLKAGAQSSSFYYLAGDNSNASPMLVKVDPLTDSYTELYTAGKYDVYKMAVSSDGVVTFSALRLSDGKKVFVKIDSNGSETVINEELNVKASVLVQIN